MRSIAKRRHSSRELHLVDVENLLGSGRITAAGVSALRETFTRIAGPSIGAQDDVHQIIATSSSVTVFAAAEGWPGAKVAFQRGEDGADHALLTAGEFCPERRYARVVIGSGDHAFAPYAARLQALGVSVTVLAREGSISAALRLAVRDIRVVPDLHWRPVHPSVRPMVVAPAPTLTR